MEHFGSIKVSCKPQLVPRRSSKIVSLHECWGTNRTRPTSQTAPSLVLCATYYLDFYTWLCLVSLFYDLAMEWFLILAVNLPVLLPPWMTWHLLSLLCGLTMYASAFLIFPSNVPFIMIRVESTIPMIWYPGNQCTKLFFKTCVNFLRIYSSWF